MASPAVGDRVKAEFTGLWTANGTVALPNGTEVWVTSPTTGLPIANLVILERASILSPGQIWQRKSDGVLFTVTESGTGRTVLPTRDGAGAPISEGSFNSGQFTLVFDPKEL